MQLAGGEKRIQALFCELSHDDQSVAPQFEKLWNRAAAINPKPVRSFSRSFAMIAAGLVIALLCSLALWLGLRSVEAIQSVDITTEAISTPAEQHIFLSTGPKKQKRVIRQRKFKPPVTNYAITLSNWQSPTQILLESSSSVILKTSPQLNQPVRELESFLPSEVKETKQ